MARFPDIRRVFYQTIMTDGVRWEQGLSGGDWGCDEWAGRFKRAFPLQLRDITRAQFAAVRNFIYSQAGAPFYWFEHDKMDMHSDVLPDETPSGIQNTFTIPGDAISAIDVFIDDIEDNNYSLSTASGPQQEDRIVFTDGNYPQTGEEITVNFTGRIRRYVHFDGNYNMFAQYRKDIDIVLIEVAPSAK